MSKLRLSRAEVQALSDDTNDLALSDRVVNTGYMTHITHMNSRRNERKLVQRKASQETREARRIKRALLELD